jgi:hypothetical protein
VRLQPCFTAIAAAVDAVQRDDAARVATMLFADRYDVSARPPVTIRQRVELADDAMIACTLP